MIENRVQNAISIKVDETAKTVTEEILENVVDYDPFSDLCDDVTAAIISDMENESFMTQDLSLTDKQKELLREHIATHITNAKKVYKGKLETDKRTKELSEFTKNALKGMLERLLSAIGQEFNRGAIINAIAVSADSKAPDYNKIELRHSKTSGDITIPTRGVFMSTNCIEALQKSIEAAGEPNEELPADSAEDTEDDE
ncbi:MAG: hypothetical protein J6Y25_04645 [Elusimicrobiaceae bacterium]|nr:hypothetical protein [Elusimicrobiaceae bacterium]